MSDELVKRLLDWPYQGETMAHEAAERIEALTAERDEARKKFDDTDLCWNGLAPCGWSLTLIDKADTAEAERDRLREALLDHNDLLRSAIAIAEREGVRGEIASTNWDAYYNRAAVVLKRHHQITTDARAALKGESHE